MKNKKAMIVLFLSQALCFSLTADPAFHEGGAGVINLPVPINKRIGFDQRLNALVPLNLTFTDENSSVVRLGEYFGHGPVVLGLVYYGCPNLCTLTMNGLFKAIGDLTVTAGKDYNVVLVSIDPTETPKLAADKKRNYLRRYGRDEKGDGIHFLTGGEKAIQALAKAVGFRYLYDAEHHQYAHPAGLTLLTPEGHISRYLFGVDFSDNSLRLGLVEASRRRIGSPIDSFLLFCYHYDPAVGTYTFVMQNVIKAGATLIVLMVGLGISYMLWAEKRNRRVVT